jgi:hypothetical protein
MRRVASCLALVALLVVSAPGTSGAVLVSTLERTAPGFQSYAFNVDQTTFDFSMPGEVTAELFWVGDGNETTDFLGFPAGRMALIERGVTAFSEKVSKAMDAGASAAIIYDNLFIPIHGGSYGGGNPYIPSVMTTRQVGLDLLGLMSDGPVTVHMVVRDVPPVPEPGTWLLLTGGLLGLVGMRRRPRA